jgi:glycosyltransferase involved in cell wall biosynthesis
VRRYTLELARALSAGYPEDTYYLVSDQPFEMPAGPPNLLRGRGPTNPVARRWWMAGLPRELQRLGADVFHGTDFAVPYLPLRPTVMTIHDLSPWRVESAADTSERVRFRTPLLVRLGLANMIITPSEAIRREVMEQFGVMAQRVAAIPLAASPHFRPVEAEAGSRPYFLYVGSLVGRKNVEVIESAAAQLGVELLMPARNGRVPEEELPALYSGAAAVLYPSLYEGFGLPVLEAMQCGAMVITTKDPAITEVAEGAAVQVDPWDAGAWVAAMRAALDPEQRAVWRGRALSRAAGYSWERTAMLTREVYDEARRLF